MAVLSTGAGCGQGISGNSNTVEVDAGEFQVQDVNQLTPGDAPAMQRLSAEIQNTPDAEVYIVKWKTSFYSGDSFRRKLTYDRKAGTLIDDSNGYKTRYEGVTVEQIHNLARQHSTADALPSLGARRLPPASSKS